MKTKKIILISCFIILILSLNAISATNTNETTTDSNILQKITNDKNTENNVIKQNSNMVYVNTNAESSQEDGSINSPYKTLNNSNLEKISSDSTIQVSEGTYNIDSLTFNKNLSIIGENKEGVIFIPTEDTNTFIIENGVTMNFINFTFKNFESDSNSAIVNNGNLSIDNINFINNTGTTQTSKKGNIYNTGNISIQNSNFENNTASFGAALYNTANAIVSDSTFNTNHIYNVGGAIYSLKGNLEVYDSKFTKNAAVSGAAIYNAAGYATINNTEFIKNDAEHFFGGAMYSTGITIVNNSIFDSNHASIDGGAITNTNNFTIINSSFIENSADENGGVIENVPWSVTENGNLTIINSTFADNSAGNYGGAIINYGKEDSVGEVATITIRNSLFEFNTARSGGLIYNEQYINFQYNVFLDNTADEGGAIYSDESLIKSLDNNWWGMNDLSVDDIGVMPERWIVLNFTNTTTFAKNLNTTLQVSLNTNNNGESLNSTITSRNATFSATTTKFPDNNMQISNVIETTVKSLGDTITVSVDNQDLSLQPDDKISTVITHDTIEDTPLGEKVTITGILSDTTENNISGATINILLNNVKYTVKTDRTGTFTFTNLTNVLGINNITLKYEGNDDYYEYSTNTTFNVYEKTDPDIRLAGSEIHPGKSKTFFAIFPSDATGTVTLKIDDTIIGENITVENGQVIYTYLIPESYQHENYTLYLNYSGDKVYNSKILNVTLILTPDGGKINSTMIMDNYTVKYSSTNNLTVYLDDDAFGSILLEINGTNITESINFTDGIATIPYTANLTPGKYLLNITYEGNYKYNQGNINATLTISKLDSKITVAKVSAKAGNTTLFTANITDEFANRVSGMNVTFYLNDTVMGSNVSNSKGLVQLYYKLPSTLYEKNFTITAKGTSTSTVLNSTGQSILKLKKLTTRVMVPNISTIPSRYTTITATIVDEFNNSVTKGNVTFKKDKLTIATVEVDNGYAKFQYESNYETATRSYIYASYVGDWKYGNSKGNGTYKVTKLKTSISSSSLEAKPDSEIILTARLLDENQNAVTEGNVTFTLAGKVLGTVEVSKGNAKLRYTLDEYTIGDYKITAAYNESRIYKASTDTSILSVSRYSVTLKGSSINAVVGNITTITLTVVDEEGYNVKEGTVQFYINEENIGKANVSNGMVSLDYKVPSKYDGKTVKYYANYLRNDLYESSSYSDTMLISHQKIVYVSPSGSDKNLGDKQHPFKTIAHAIEHITLFGTIYLDEGTYPTSGITLNNSITIIGSGKDKTFINGQKSGQPIFNMSKRNVVLTLDGVTIMNGKSTQQFSAGAIVTSGKLTITNSRFVNNTGAGNYSGGAIYTNGVLNVTNTEFINNVVNNPNSQGGAIRTYSNTTYITNCTFDSNKVTGSNSTGGSTLYSDSGDIIINGTTFNKNSATGMYVTGGVIRIIYGALVIDNSTFTNNMINATNYGIGGVIGSIGSGVSIVNSNFTSNTINAKNSAGASVAYVETAVLEMKNSQVSSNKISSKECYGGALYGYLSYILLNKDTFSYNKVNATNNAYGGVLYTYGGNITVKKSKFLNNTLDAKNMALAGVLYSSSNANITNSYMIGNRINASNLGGGAIANMNNLTITNTNMVNNYAYDAGNAITATATSTNNIEGNYWGSTNPEWDKLLNGLSAPSNYSNTTIIVKQSVNLVVDSFTGMVGEKVTLRATITDEDGDPVTSGNIVFKLNGRTLRLDGRFDTNNSSPLKLHVSNGVVTYTMTADTYLRYGKNITASYSGAANYEESTSNVAQANIQLRYAKITLTVKPTTVKQYNYVTFTAKVTDTYTSSKSKALINNGIVMFKVNGVLVKDAHGNPIQVKVVNGIATYKYYVQGGTGGIDKDGKVRNYTVTAIYSNPSYYPKDNKANGTYNVKRSNITINIASAKVKSTMLTVKANITDYMGNLVTGTNKVAVKINGATYNENGTYKYFTVTNGQINLKGIKVNPSNIKTVELVTGERQAYLSGRAITKVSKA